MEKDSKEVLLDLGLKDLELISLMNYHFKYTTINKVSIGGAPAVTLTDIIGVLEKSTEAYIVDLIQDLDYNIGVFTFEANKNKNKVAKDIIKFIKIRLVLFILLDKLLGLYDLSLQGVTGKDKPVLAIGNPTACVFDFYQYQFILKAYKCEFFINMVPTYSGTARTTFIDKIKDLELKVNIENLTRPNKAVVWYTHVNNLSEAINTWLQNSI